MLKKVLEYFILSVLLISVILCVDYFFSTDIEGLLIILSNLTKNFLEKWRLMYLNY
jgi:hypothetical protein